MLSFIAFIAIVPLIGQHVVEEAFQHSTEILDGRPLPLWRGALVSRSVFESSPEADLILVDRVGVHRRVPLSFEGAERLIVSDAIQLRDDTLALAGTVWNSSAQVAAMVAILNPDGSIRVVRRTNPFKAIRLVQAADGLLWIFGQNIADGIDGLYEDHHVFQVLDSSGKLIRSHTLASSLSKTRMIPTANALPEGFTTLLASRDRVGLYIARLRQWTEYSLDGRLLGAWTLPLPTFVVNGREQFGHLTGIALTGANRLVAYFRQPDGVPGSGYFELDRVARTWKPMDTFDPKRHVMLWGADQDRVLVSASDAPAGLRKYLWVSLNSDTTTR